MSGYNIALNRTKEDPLNIMLNNMKNGSRVLEFGCANGRMTRYMTEIMDCIVDVVEYDKELYKIAMQYANDGLCGDILDFEWLEKYNGKTYDYIIFADVLEHLMNPQMVLEKCHALLKQDGIIWISVPNIAHNDIMIKLMEEKFEYTETGLLDCTHVHFFTLNSAKGMFASAGYYVAYEDATYVQTFCTEQLLLSSREWKSEYNIFKRRYLGEAYQFVFALTKDETRHFKCADYANYDNACKYYERRMYIDCGQGYDNESITKVLASDKEFQIYIALPEKAEMVWIRPAFRKRFMIKELVIYADDKIINYCHINGENREGALWFDTLDGNLYINDFKGCSALTIKGTIMVDGDFEVEACENEEKDSALLEGEDL